MAANKCEPKGDPRKRFCFTLSEEGSRCLAENQQLYGVSCASDMIEMSLLHLRHCDQTEERHRRMLMCQAMREVATEDARALLSTCMTPSKAQATDSQKR